MRGIRILVRALPIGLASLLVVGLAVLTFIRVTRTVESPGEVRAQNYEVIRAATPGIVEQVLVEPGEAVRAGDPLFRLRDFELEKSITEVRRRLYDARIERLSVERRRRRLDIEIHPLEKARQEKSSAESRLTELTSASRTRELELQLKRSKESHARMQGLFDAGLISAQALTESKYDFLQAEERHRQSILEEELAKERRIDTGNAEELLAAEHRDILADLETQEKQLLFLIEQLETDEQRLSRQGAEHELRAGLDGILVSDAVNDLYGRKVEPGEELASILDISSVYFTAYVPEAAILKVREGQEAFVELTGLPKRTFDIFEGQVAKVAKKPDLGRDDTLYPVEVRLHRPWVIWNQEKFYVRSGMRGQVKISYRGDVSVLRAIYEALIGEPGVSSPNEEPRRAHFEDSQAPPTTHSTSRHNGGRP